MVSQPIFFTVAMNVVLNRVVITTCIQTKQRITEHNLTQLLMALNTQETLQSRLSAVVHLSPHRQIVWRLVNYSITIEHLSKQKLSHSCHRRGETSTIVQLPVPVILDILLMQSRRIWFMVVINVVEMLDSIITSIQTKRHRHKMRQQSRVSVTPKILHNVFYKMLPSLPHRPLALPHQTPCSQIRHISKNK